ncbi:hypothetical protein [Pseudomonas sp.]
MLDVQHWEDEEQHIPKSNTKRNGKRHSKHNDEQSDKNSKWQ